MGPGLPLLRGTLNYDPKAFHMSSVMHVMRLANAAIRHFFEQRLAIARADAGQANYLAFVCAMWGWVASCERRLWSLEWPAELMPGSRDGKRRWLDCDIRTGLGEGMAHGITRSPHMPKMDTLAECFGVAHVIEGAQVGSQVLRKTMGAALQSRPARGLARDGDGDTVGNKWLAFRTISENILLSRADIALAAAPARATFESLIGWFQKTGMA